MNERTPVSAYRLLSSQCDKSIVFISSHGSSCIFSLICFFDLLFICLYSPQFGNDTTRTLFEGLPAAFRGGDWTLKEIILWDDENLSLRVDPPLQFCSKLLYIYHRLWGIIWLNESKISRSQRDDKYFFLGWEYLFESLNEKINSKKKKSHLQPWKIVSPLNQLVCLLAPWG